MPRKRALPELPGLNRTDGAQKDPPAIFVSLSISHLSHLHSHSHSESLIHWLAYTYTIFCMTL
jgi:hypothetical protein